MPSRMQKDIPVQQEPKPVAEDEWRFVFTTPYLWLPSSSLDIFVPERTIGGRTIGGDFSIDVPWWEVLSKFSSDFYVLSLSGASRRGKAAGADSSMAIGFSATPNGAIPGWSCVTGSISELPRASAVTSMPRRLISGRRSWSDGQLPVWIPPSLSFSMAARPRELAGPGSGWLADHGQPRLSRARSARRSISTATAAGPLSSQ